MYRNIFFDLDGTLTDSKEGILNCVRYAIEQIGDPVPPEDTLLRFIGPPLQESFAVYCGYGPEKIEWAVTLYRERYGPVGQFENYPAPGASDMLARLKERGCTLALASSKPEHLCRSICERFGFTPHLSAIAGSTPSGDRSKADVIRAVMDALGLTDADRPSILMVGDRKFDVLGAKACGIDCLGVEFFGYAAPHELEDHGAVAVVRTTQELEDYILSH